MATLAATSRYSVSIPAVADAGPFEVGFRIFGPEISVFVDGVATTAYTLSANFTNGYDDNAQITFASSVAAGSTVWIQSDLPIARGADYLVTDPGLTRKLNIELPRITSMIGDLRRDLGQAPSVADEFDIRTYGLAIDNTAAENDEALAALAASNVRGIFDLRGGVYPVSAVPETPTFINGGWKVTGAAGDAGTVDVVYAAGDTIDLVTQQISPGRDFYEIGSQGTAHVVGRGADIEVCAIVHHGPSHYGTGTLPHLYRKTRGRPGFLDNGPIATLGASDNEASCFAMDASGFMQFGIVRFNYQDSVNVRHVLRYRRAYEQRRDQTITFTTTAASAIVTCTLPEGQTWDVIPGDRVLITDVGADIGGVVINALGPGDGTYEVLSHNPLTRAITIEATNFTSGVGSVTAATATRTTPELVFTNTAWRDLLTLKTGSGWTLAHGLTIWEEGGDLRIEFGLHGSDFTGPKFRRVTGLYGTPTLSPTVFDIGTLTAGVEPDQVRLSDGSKIGTVRASTSGMTTAKLWYTATGDQGDATVWDLTEDAFGGSPVAVVADEDEGNVYFVLTDTRDNGGVGTAVNNASTDVPLLIGKQSIADFIVNGPNFDWTHLRDLHFSNTNLTSTSNAVGVPAAVLHRSALYIFATSESSPVDLDQDGQPRVLNMRLAVGPNGFMGARLPNRDAEPTSDWIGRLWGLLRVGDVFVPGAGPLSDDRFKAWAEALNGRRGYVAPGTITMTKHITIEADDIDIVFFGTQFSDTGRDVDAAGGAYSTRRLPWGLSFEGTGTCRVDGLDYAVSGDELSGSSASFFDTTNYTERANPIRFDGFSRVESINQHHSGDPGVGISTNRAAIASALGVSSPAGLVELTFRSAFAIFHDCDQVIITDLSLEPDACAREQVAIIGCGDVTVLRPRSISSADNFESFFKILHNDSVTFLDPEVSDTSNASLIDVIADQAYFRYAKPLDYPNGKALDISHEYDIANGPMTRLVIDNLRTNGDGVTNVGGDDSLGQITDNPVQFVHIRGLEADGADVANDPIAARIPYALRYQIDDARSTDCSVAGYTHQVDGGQEIEINRWRYRRVLGNASVDSNGRSITVNAGGRMRLNEMDFEGTYDTTSCTTNLTGGGAIHIRGGRLHNLRLPIVGGTAVTVEDLVITSASGTPTLADIFPITSGTLVAINCILNGKRVSTVPTEYADDTAAAAGGIPVGGLYRTGSALKTRVS